MLPNAALLIRAVFGQCSIQTELLQTTLSAKHPYVAGENGLDNALSHNLHQIQSQMTPQAAVDIGAHMTKPQRHLLSIALVPMKLRIELLARQKSLMA
jgi:hypothetical protein